MVPPPARGAMACRWEQPQAAPAIVAQRLCDLLLSFPAAAACGVQWQVLARKYEERYSTRLDLERLGYSSALAAASALLWEVVRLVDTADVDNPIVGVEDVVALVPRPGLLGSWPSLYNTLCELVLGHGTPFVSNEAAGGSCGASGASGAKCLLFSMLRPLLEQHWHAGFDESSLGFLGEDGTYRRLKKMKHLLSAVLSWRRDRLSWQEGRKASVGAVDEALAPELELTPSKKYNDLLLVCSATPCAVIGKTSGDAPVTPARLAAPAMTVTPAQAAMPVEDAAGRLPEATPVASEAVGPSGAAFTALQLELQRLQEENRELKTRNTVLESGLAPNIFDDPFEPPPEAHTRDSAAWAIMRRKGSADLSSTTDAESEAGFDTSLSSVGSFASGSGAATPVHTQGCTSMPARFDLSFSSVGSLASGSGAATPVHAAPVSQGQQGCAFMPVWFSVVQSSQAPWAVIPQGIVQTGREYFERLTAATK